MKRMRKFAGFLVVGAGLLLSGCGFQPLYGTAEDGSGVSARLAEVDVVEQDTRLGQLIRNEIVANITPAGTASGSTYRLELYPDGRYSTLVDSSNTEALRELYMLKVRYSLINSANGKPVHSGNTFSRVSFDRTTAPAANLQARTNAQERAAREVGQDIRTRLAAWFASN